MKTERNFKFALSYANKTDKKRSEAFYCMEFNSYEECEKNAKERLRDMAVTDGYQNVGHYIISLSFNDWAEMTDIANVWLANKGTEIKVLGCTH